MALYELDVPGVNPGALEGGDSRYGCCHQTAEQGHAETCVPETRARYIEEALERAGISFTRCRQLNLEEGGITADPPYEPYEADGDKQPGLEATLTDDPAKRLLDTVREPNVIEELRTARASIEHALIRLGGSSE